MEIDLNVYALEVPMSVLNRIQVVTEALSIAEEMSYEKGAAIAHLRLAYYNNILGNFLIALEHSRRLIYISSLLQSGPDSLNILGAYSQLSITYRGLERYDSAIYYGQESLRIVKRIGDCTHIASRNLEMAKLYSQIGDYQAELQAYLDGYTALKYCPDKNLRAGYVTYSRRLGYYYMTHGNYKEALKYFLEADSIYGKIHLISMREKSYHARQASNIARVYQHWGKLDSAMVYRRMALKRFLDYGFPEENINVPNQYCYIGTIYSEWGDFISAREYFERSLALRKSNGDSLGAGMCLDEMAVSAKHKGQHQLAVQLLLESLHWKLHFRDARIDPSRRAQWIESRSETYMILGQVFAEWDKFDDALLYYDTAMMLNRQVGYKRGQAQVEYYRGIAWQQKGAQDTAFKYFQRSRELSESMDNKPLEARAKTGLGKLLLQKGEFEPAMWYFQAALKTYQDGGFIRELPEMYLVIGQTISQQGYRPAAINEYKKAYEGAASLGMINIQSEAANALASLYEEQGDIRLSNKYLKDYILLHDSVFTLETHRQLVEMQAFHESQQQQVQILQLQQHSELNKLRAERSQYVIISLGGIVIIVLLFAVLFFRQIHIRNQQKALINQQQLFRSQMNPHFIFNSLTNIQHYIFSKDSLSAGKYLAVFAKLMRSILNNSSKEIISLRDEISTISQYLDLQQLRMEDKLEYEIDVDEALDPEITDIPPMLAQPFIENAIEHGIRNKEGGGRLVVRIRKEDNFIIYEIEDDGVGRKKVAEIQEGKNRDHESMAVSLTRSRLQSIWGRRKPGKVLEILDLEDSEGNPLGTLVRFKVPNS